jgi:hypothetical protein
MPDVPTAALFAATLPLAIALRKRHAALTVVLLAVFAALCVRLRLRPRLVAVLLAFGVLMTAVEALCIVFGMWQYNVAPPRWLVPAWLPPGWSIAGLFVLVLVRALGLSLA